MHVKQLFGSDDRAVSPVIGVILMVAVTVILAAVVSMLVLGMGQNVNNNPQATFSFDYNSANHNVTITHDGGDTLDASRVSILNDNTSVNSIDPWSASGKLAAGSSTAIKGYAGDTIKVVWQGNNGETAVLATYQVPT